MNLRELKWGARLLLTVLIFASTAHYEADACNCLYKEPMPRFITAGDVLPANAEGVVMFGPCEYRGPKGKKPTKQQTQYQTDKLYRPPKQLKVMVERIGDDDDVSIPHTTSCLGRYYVLIKPKVSMKIGETYRFSFDDGSAVWPAVKLTVGGDRLDQKNGKAVLEMGPPKKANVSIARGAMCSCTDRTCVRDIELLLPKTGKKYNRSLLFETVVDGKVWHHQKHTCERPPHWVTTAGRGKVRLHRETLRCGWGLSKGVHKVRMTATLPGVGVIADSGEVEVEMGCE